jgi:transposase
LWEAIELNIFSGGIIMLYIGIDVAKDKHDAHIMSSDGEVLCDYLSFSNSREGFNELLDQINLSCEIAQKQKVKVGIESTGHYSTNLIHFLESQDFEVLVYNPLSVCKLKEAGSLRRTKTDKNDSRYLAKMLMTVDVNPHVHLSCHIDTLKSLTRARFRLVKEIQPLKNRYRKTMHLLFPELEKFFWKMYSNSILKLLESLPSAKDIAGCNILKLTKILSENSRGRLKRDKAEELKDLAKNSIATYNRGLAFEMQLMVKRLLFLESQKEIFEEEITTIMKEINSPIMSIPGIGYVLGAVILAEIKDINAFSSSAKLLAFAGCEPSVYQSGKYVATDTPMVKRGSKYLRHALYLATYSAFLHSPSFTEYINRKRAQNKHFFVAMSHGMKKMTRVIYATLTKNIAFVEPNSVII